MWENFKMLCENFPTNHSILGDNFLFSPYTNKGPAKYVSFTFLEPWFGKTEMCVFQC